MTSIEIRFTGSSLSNTFWVGNTTSANGVITAYNPTVPAEGATSHAESAEILLTGGTVALIDAAINSLNGIAREAKLYTRSRLGSQIYVQITDGANVYRSPLMDVRFEPNEDAWRGDYAGGLRGGTLVWERKPWKESTTETQIPLTNGNGTSSTDALAVYSCNDGSTDTGPYYHQYAAIVSSDVAGDLLAPLKVEMTAGSSDALRNFVLSVARIPDVLRTAVYEGESGTGGTGLTSSTDVSSTDCSGDKYMSLIYSGDSTWRAALYWALGTTDVTFNAGDWYKPVIRWQAAPGINVSAKFKLETAGGVVMQETNSVSISSTSTELTTICPPLQIPPYILPTALYGLNLQLYLYGTSASSDNVKLDCVTLHCLDSFRLYTAQVALTTSDQVIDDPIGGYLYGTVGATNTATHTAVGSPLEVEPARPQRIWYQALSGLIADFVTMKAWYRPRWRG